jgi:hypothetical protein
MSIKFLLLLLGSAGVLGIAIGYWLRWLVSLGQKGSVELDIKQKLLEAREQAEKIVLDAEKRRTSVEEEIREEFKSREERLFSTSASSTSTRRQSASKRR